MIYAHHLLNRVPVTINNSEIESTMADNSFTDMEIDHLLVDDDTPVADNWSSMQDVDRCMEVSSNTDPRAFHTRIEISRDSINSLDGSVVDHNISLQDAYQCRYPVMFCTKPMDISMVEQDTSLIEMSALEEAPVGPVRPCVIHEEDMNEDMNMSIDFKPLDIANSSISNIEEVLTTSTPNDSADQEPQPAMDISGIAHYLGMSLNITCPWE